MPSSLRTSCSKTILTPPLVSQALTCHCAKRSICFMYIAPCRKAASSSVSSEACATSSHACVEARRLALPPLPAAPDPVVLSSSA